MPIPSRWIAYLKALQPGETFQVHCSEAGTVRKHIEALGIIHEVRRFRSPNNNVRFWVLGQPWVPEYLNPGLDI